MGMTMKGATLTYRDLLTEMSKEVPKADSHRAAHVGPLTDISIGLYKIPCTTNSRRQAMPYYGREALG
jgi:hypothetical protein